ncbi:signal transduction histidine kinase [Catenuloplanes nepalensis]|uniref:histidine kinase n=2 Tax=Catenuloplanes nepalensis TaxID=587533 RepID=A0ABT9N6L5_9ACTN|nr:nitrate- and nitrite sensing domain-containing protein [Catenuloplanes nepalensis]MDP9799185.1 signal transduction histidine kinase [Catenuloplanes nepalensis]
MILVVPVAAILVLASMRLWDSTSRAADAGLVRSLTALSLDVSALSHDLHGERMAAARLLAGGNNADLSNAFTAATAATDQRIASYQASRRDLSGLPENVESRLDTIDSNIDERLDTTRQDVLAGAKTTPQAAVLRYGVVMDDLMAYLEVISQTAGEGDLADSLRTAFAFSNAKNATAEEQAVAYVALLGNRNLGKEQLASFLATLAEQQEAQVAVTASDDEALRGVITSTITGDAVTFADRVANTIITTAGSTARPEITADAASAAIGAVANLMRHAEVDIEQQLIRYAEEEQSAVVQLVIIEIAAVLIALAVAIALAFLLARSLNASLRRLREGAMTVANHDLPDAVARLRDVRSLGEGGADEIVKELRDPIRLNTRDEVGEVAQAFNVVHREAVRIAAEQAALRTSVSAMFLNLARRSQALVDRMIGELDKIERGEEDPKRLAQLFQLDHLATRMRRNDENLLVLAGADSAPPRREDALLIDVLRASQSEVELYNRIEFGTVDTDISVSAHAVNDVVRLVAELLDNATRFSPPNTVVVADARRVRDYVLIQVEDRGLGMTEEQMESLNQRLDTPPTVDVGAFRLMGLAVVGRLASRYGVRVELRPNVEGGTVAQVTLPHGVVVLPRTRGREPALPRPRSPLAVEQGPSAPVSSPPAWGESLTPSRTATLTPPREPAEQWQQPAPQQPRDFQVNAGTPTQALPVAGQNPLRPHPQQGVTQQLPTIGGSAFPSQRQTQPAAIAPASVTPVAAPPVAPPPVAPPAPVQTPIVPPVTSAPEAQTISATVHPMSASAGGVSTAPFERGGAPAEQAEAPIFRQMEAVWFRTHGQADTAVWSMPTAGYAPPPVGGTSTPSPSASSAMTAETTALPVRSPEPAAPRRSESRATSYGTETSTQPSGGNPAPMTSGFGAPAAPAAPVPAPAAAPSATPDEATWRTAADDGWKRAQEAAKPATSGTTRSGLPKRKPQAQLVPGGVETKPAERARRTPDEVRGLLSAYHRGVHRGRSAGAEAGDAESNPKETNG